ncbi:MAG TPA: hypothetical protein DCY88_32620 [Cyanobacteria bacterium UBA11372]|nr:hypothetical protein [Cyanobacteria bacterium UBA11372]
MGRFWSFCLVLVCLLWGGEALAGPLNDRLAQFPNWDGKPLVQAVVGAEDLIYPDWMAGTWKVTSTLVDLAAPLAPEIVTPGFESNRRYLNQPVTFLVRFQGVNSFSRFNFPVFNRKSNSPLPILNKGDSVVADRAFNGLNIGNAVLGDRSILSVKVDPDNPNRQITSLPGDRQLISVVTSRGTEMPSPHLFISTEVCQQVFRGTKDIYLNEVETTTAYRHQNTPGALIEADQITAVYLSPQDPNYFAVGNRPVALYRYRLEITK